VEEILRVVNPLLIFATGGLVGWVWSLWVSHNNHKLEVATNYVKHTQLEKVREDLMKELKFVRDMIIRITHALKIESRGDERNE